VPTPLRRPRARAGAAAAVAVLVAAVTLVASCRPTSPPASSAAAPRAASPTPTPVPATVAAATPTILYGDSISAQAEWYLERFYPSGHQGRPLLVKAMGGTAPCDWVGRVRADLAARPRPRSIVLEFYGNSFTPCMGGSGPVAAGLAIGSAGFLRAYGRSMSEVQAAAGRAGVPVTWLVPPVRPGSDPAPTLNETLAAMARRRGWAVSDAADALADARGRWTRTLPCAPWEGPDHGCEDGRVPVRDRSLVHFWAPAPAAYSPGAFRWAAAATRLLP
jgi:hypothetical protein